MSARSFQENKEPSGWLCKSRPPAIRWVGLLIVFVLGLVPICGLGAQEGLAPRGFPPFLYAAEGARQIQQYDRQGRVSWAYPAEMARDVWALTNGHVLFCFNNDYRPDRHDNVSGVLEVTADKRIAFQFMTTGQVWSCQRLADGNTLVAAASQGQLLIVSPDARIIQTIPVLNTPGHSCLRNARQLPNGHFLVAEESAHAAREYSREGKLVREIRLSFAPFSAVRLDHGNTVICGQQKIVEVEPRRPNPVVNRRLGTSHSGHPLVCGPPGSAQRKPVRLQCGRGNSIPGTFSRETDPLAQSHGENLPRGPRHPALGCGGVALQVT